MPESRKRVVVEERPDFIRIAAFAACAVLIIGLAVYYTYPAELEVDISTLLQQPQISGALEFLIVNQLSPVSVFQHGAVNPAAYFDLSLLNLTNQNLTNTTLTGYTCSGSQCNFTIVLDNDNSSALSYFLNVSDFAIQSVFYNASDGSLRNVSELSSIGQGNWSYNSSVLNYTLPGADGWDYGIRDTALGGSYWLNSTSGLYGKINVSNDFITVELTENGTRVFNSSGKAIFNTSFNDAVKLDNQNLISFYGGGTQNKTVYFFDWAEQKWKVWVGGSLVVLDSFNSDLWNDSNSTAIGVNSQVGELYVNDSRTGTQNSAAYDLQRNFVTGADDSSWTLRFKFKTRQFSAGDGNWYFIVLSSSNQTFGSDSSQDFIGIRFRQQTTKQYHAVDGDGNIPINDLNGDGQVTKDFSATGTWWYAEVKRTNGTSYTVEVFDNNFPELGGVSAGKISGLTNITTQNLRFIKVMNWYNSGVPDGGDWDVSIDDVQFWNGGPDSGMPDWTDPRNKQVFKWRYAFARENKTKMNITYLMTAHDPFVRTFVDTSNNIYFWEDYSSSSGWTSQGSGDITITGGTAFANQVGNPDAPAATDRIYKSLGANLTQRWRLDFDFNFTSCTSGSYYAIPITLTAGNSEAWFYGGEPNQDAVAALFLCNPGTEGMHLRVKDGSTLTSGTPINVIGDNSRHYQTLERDGNTFRLSMFSDPGRSNLLGTDSVTVSGISGLDTLQQGHYRNAIQTNSHGSTWYVDNVVITQDANVTFPFSLPENRTSVTTADAGLVGYWNFNDGSGLNATDVVGGNGLSLGAGSVSAMPVWVSNSSCVYGRCLGFDSGDIMSRGSTSFLSDQQGSISVWLKYSGTGDTETILDANDAATSTTDRWIVYQSTGNVLHPALIYNDGSVSLNAQITSAITDTEWHHLVTTSDGSTIRAYLDGVERSLNIAQGSNTGQWFGDLTISRLNIGANYLDGTSGFDGFMDDLRIYSRPLSPGEVRQLYLTGLNQQKPGIYFTKNNATDNEEVLFAATNWRNVNRTGFNVFSNQTNWFGFNWTFNSTANNNFMFSLGTMGRMNTTLFNPANNATAFSFETMESVANSTLTWYDLRRPVELEEGFSRCGTNECDGLWDSDNTAVFSVNTVTDKVDFSNDASSVAMRYDLGTVSETKWLMRLNFTINSLGGTNLRILHMYVSSNGQPASTATDGIEVYFYDADNNVHAASMDNVRPDQVTDNAGLSINPTAGTVYYVEMARLNETAARVAVYSDPGYTTVLGARTWAIPASIQGLRYITFSTYSGALGTFTGTIDDVQFWDGVNTVNSSLSYPFPGGVQHYVKPAFNHDGGDVGIWSFDEYGGLIAADSSGNGASGTLAGYPARMYNSSCRSGGCMYFDGGSDYIDLGKPKSLDLTGPMTFEAWVYPSSSGSHIAGNFDGAGNKAQWNLLFNSWSGGRSTLRFQSCGDAGCSGANYLNIQGTSAYATENQWNHVAVVRDAANGNVKLYVNGVQEGTVGSSTTAMIASQSQAGTNSLGSAGTYSSFKFVGRMDEARLYSRALTVQEINEHYAREVAKYHEDFNTVASKGSYRYIGVEDSNTTLQPVTPAGAVLHYRFNDNSTVNITDSSGLGKNGGALNGAVWSTNASCKYGGCMNLDGSDDKIKISGSDLNILGDVTLSAWINADDFSDGSYHSIISKRTWGGASPWSMMVHGTIDSLTWYSSVSSSFETLLVMDSRQIPTRKWVHVAMSVNGNNVTGYLDGVPIGSRNIVYRAASSDDTVIGQSTNQNNNEPYDGMIDEVIVVNRSLSPDEIYQLYLGGVQRRSGDLVGWWKFNDLGKPLLEEDFNYTSQAAADAAWQSTDTNKARVDVSTGQLSFRMESTASLQSIAYDFGPGNISDAGPWVLRYKMRLTGGTESPSAYFYSLMSSLGQASGGTVAQDAVGGSYVTFSSANPDSIGSAYVDSAAFFSSGGGHTSSVTLTWELNKDYYIDIRRISATGISVSVYSDPDYTVLLGQSGGSIASSIGGLRFFKLLNRHDVSQSGYTQGIIDDLRFWNNVTLANRNVLDSSGAGNTGQVFSNWTGGANGKNGAGLRLGGSGGYVSVSNATATDKSLSGLSPVSDMTISAWVKFPAAFTNHTEDVRQSIIDKGRYKLYFDHQDGRLKFELDNATSTDWTKSYDGSVDHTTSLAEYNGKLYAGLAGASSGDGDILVFDGNSWAVSYNSGSYDTMSSLAVYNGKLYAGQGGGSGQSDVLVFDGSSWSTSYDGSSNRIGALAVYNGKLYAGIRGAAGEGDVLVFDGSSWTTSYNGGQDSIPSLAVYNGKLYAGQGSASGAGDVLVFNGNSWSTSYDGSQEYIFGLGVYDGRLYAGQGHNSGDGDVLVFDGSSWSTSYDGSQASIRAFSAYNGRLYAAQATTGVVLVFDGTGWNTAYDPPGSTDIFSLATYSGRLYAGQGGTSGDSDVFVFGNNVMLNQSASVSSGNRSSWPSGTWQHVAATYDGSVMKIYLNGTLDSSRAAVFPVETGNDKLIIGNDFGSGFFNGTIDDVKIWKRTLTADEIMNEYRQDQDQHSLYGNIHRIAAADSLPSVIINITDHDSLYQRDHDQRVLTFMGTVQGGPDTTPPTISVQSPTNSTYNDNLVWANATINEAGTVWVRLDSGSNTSMSNSSGNWNAQLSVGNGPHNVIFYANDSSGNEATPVTVFFTVSPLVISMEVNRTFSNAFPWWADNITISGWATYNGGYPFNSTNGTIVINQTSPSGGPDRLLCQTTGNAATGFYSCWYVANYEVGDATVTVHAVRTVGTVAGSVSGTVRVRPTYGQEPAGSTPRYVLELPGLIQEPSGRVRIVLGRMTVSKGAPN